MTTTCECDRRQPYTPAPVSAALVGPWVEPHPAAGASPAEIIAHLLRVHHRSLRERLARIEALLDKTTAERHFRQRPWSDTRRKFACWQEDLVSCLLQERSTIFAPFTQQRSEPDLREAIRAIGKTHAHLLQQLWALASQVADAARCPPKHEAGQAAQTELTDLVDEYCQHLFEEECLLFPQLIASRSSGRAVTLPSESTGASSARPISQEQAQ